MKNASITHGEAKKLLSNYVIGFVLSLFCTAIAFWMVVQHVDGGHLVFSHAVIIPLLAILAFSQFLVQLVYFLHLGTERKPRWKLLVFWFMILVVMILVGGSIWIMQNLNYNMMSPQETKLYMHDHEGF